MEQRRILFVDDESNIRLTLPSILRLHGFEVIATGTVAEAIAAMQLYHFDVLIADLNIGQPGDGFTVVSAMRRIQPHAVTLILTGYPAFETALEAIRSQVDDYLVKPANIEQLVGVIERNLREQTPTRHLAPKRLAVVLAEHESEIAERWLATMAKQSPDVVEPAHIREIVKELIEMLQGRPGSVSTHALHIAEELGRNRIAAGVAMGELVDEFRVLRKVLYSIVQENLLAVNVSYVVTEMSSISDNLDQQMRVAAEAYSRAMKATPAD